MTRLGWGPTPTNLVAAMGWPMIAGTLEASAIREDGAGSSSRGPTLDPLFGEVVGEDESNMTSPMLEPATLRREPITRMTGARNKQVPRNRPPFLQRVTLGPTGRGEDTRMQNACRDPWLDERPPKGFKRCCPLDGVPFWETRERWMKLIGDKSRGTLYL